MSEMKVHVLNCGFLKVAATEMIKPLPVEAIRLRYPLETGGTMKLAMNALLVVQGERVVLLDPGCADFLPSRLAEQYGLEIPEPIEVLLASVGVVPDQVTDVVFTHLHFDHGSGAFMRLPGRIVKRFPEARYHVLKTHFDYAGRPEAKESDSFFTPLLRYVERIHWLEEWAPDWISFRVFNGHTRGLVVPEIRTPGGIICYVSDLIPMELFLEEGVYSGYDLDPVLAMEEKVAFLNEISKSTRLIYFHEPLNDSIIYP